MLWDTVKGKNKSCLIYEKFPGIAIINIAIGNFGAAATIEYSRQMRKK